MQPAVSAPGPVLEPLWRYRQVFGHQAMAIDRVTARSAQVAGRSNQALERRRSAPPVEDGPSAVDDGWPPRPHDDWA